ncbi:MAG: DUF5615 family PIN-like protein [Deltaproteobacteria bacterium]|nr:DUF5615 family PIN-like protein [Deltaproteobacteria bacterium]
MKFLLDMGISPENGKYLIKLGYDSIHLIDIGMETASDTEILDKAKKENRVILTHDLDFGRLLAFSCGGMPSVVVFRLGNMKPENVNNICKEAIIRFHDELEKGVILSIGDRKIRCHYLPI